MADPHELLQQRRRKARHRRAIRYLTVMVTAALAGGAATGEWTDWAAAASVSGAFLWWLLRPTRTPVAGEDTLPITHID